LCPISANSIPSQLVKNRAHKTRNCEPTRLINKELSDILSRVDKNHDFFEKIKKIGFF